MTKLFYSDSFSDDVTHNITEYTFQSNKEDEIYGTFVYKIIPDEPIDEKGIQEVLGYTFAREFQGICTWKELPEFIRDEFDKLITPEERMRYQLVSRTVTCDGFLYFPTENLE
jgi:hypothetical protein